MGKCPLCGHAMPAKDFRSKVKLAILQFSPKTAEAINNVAVAIEQERKRKLTSGEKFAFLKQIERIEEIVIRRGIDIFIDKNLHKAGYGLRYLAGVIKNENSRLRMKIKHEQETLDRLPPEVS